MAEEATTGDKNGICASLVCLKYPAIMATAAMGRLKEFHPESESIIAYLDSMCPSTTLNPRSKCRVIGMKPYSLISGLVLPVKPEHKSLEELKTILKRHYDPEPIVIAERFRFYQRTQKPGESIADFLASLRKLATRCKFGGFLAEALRDRLVCGLHSEAIQKALLANPDLTLDSARDTALGMEAAAKRTKELKCGGPGFEANLTCV